MATKLFLLPLFLHVLLILYVGLKTLRARFKSVRTGQAKLSEIAIDAGAWPRKVRALGNNFDNQFETPMLWYAGSALVVALQSVDMIFVGLSWTFLVSRILHSYEHTHANDVPARLRFFLFGFAILFVMWVWLAIKLFIVG